jgi:hypothetical protein
MKSRFTFILLIICSINCSFGQVSDTFKQGVDSLSAICLKVELFNKGNKISSATGFVIEKNANYYLITNLHVVTGIDFYSKAIIDPQLRTPDEVGIWHNTIRFGQWHFTKDDGLNVRSLANNWI